MEEVLLYFALKYEGDWDLIYQAINKKEKVNEEEKERLINANTNSYITLISNNYPNRLKNIYKPPFVLFYKGNIDLVNTPHKTIGVVGSRRSSYYGREATNNIVKELVDENCVIVSGLASGIDSVAHKTCIANGGQTIAVLGNGLEVDYPLTNKELKEEVIDKGLILSEYPDFTVPIKENFPKRNRIIAGLSDGVLVGEAREKSGSMITVSRALEMGKEIFCLPYPYNKNSGCNLLIKQGAKLVENARDILCELY